MYNVTPLDWFSRSSASMQICRQRRAADRPRHTSAPPGRGRSVGSASTEQPPTAGASKTAHAPASRLAASHAATWRSRRTGRAARAVGTDGPSTNAVYNDVSSCTNTPSDQPSETMWWSMTNRTCSCSSSRRSIVLQRQLTRIDRTVARFLRAPARACFSRSAPCEMAQVLDRQFPASAG